LVKTCTKCDTEYPATVEYFHRDKKTKDGLYPSCKKCKIKYNQQHRKDKKEYDWHYRQTLNGRLRIVYKNMKQRCQNPKNKDYYCYGGRGIRVLFKSVDDFVDYVANDLKVDPRGLTIDRIDNDGHYEKGNIRFVTQAENNKNKGKSNAKKKN